MEGNTKKTRNYVVDTDEGPRADTAIDKLAKLRPVFSAGGSVTAGNASQTSDGAAMVLVMSEDMVKELGVTPIARMVRWQIRADVTWSSCNIFSTQDHAAQILFLFLYEVPLLSNLPNAMTCLSK